MSKGKLYYAKIDVAKIRELKDYIFKGKKGEYLDLSIWLNEDEDQFGNVMSIQHYNKDTKNVTYVGTGKEPTGKKDDGVGF